MKVIPVNKIISVNPSAQNPTYIADWMLTDDPKQSYKSTGTSATLTLTVCRADCITFFNHNANNISIIIKRMHGETLAGPFNTDFTSYAYGNNCLWQEYPHQSGYHQVIATVSNARSNPFFAGIGWAGEMIRLRNPKSGMDIAYIDNSIDRVMSSKTEKQTEKDIKKEFSFNIMTHRDTEWFRLNRSIKNNIDITPVPWLIQDNKKREYCIFGRLEELPAGTHAHPRHSLMPLRIFEA